MKKNSAVDTAATDRHAERASAASDHGLRRRASDAMRLSPVRRFFYECLVMVALLPWVLVWLSARDGLWHADALVHDLMLAQGSHPAGQDIVVVSMDDPCPPNRTHCAALSMRYRELLDHLRDQPPRAVLLDTGPLNASEVEGLRHIARARMDAGGAPTHLLHSPTPAGRPAWSDIDRDGLTRGIRPWRHTAQGLEQHPAVDALGLGTPSEHWPEHIDLRWRTGAEAGYPTLSYAGLLLGQHPAPALRDKLVVAGPRFSGAALPPWLVRVGTSIQTLTPTDALAQVVDNLARQRWVRPVGPVWHWLWVAVPLWAALWLTRRWPERLAPLLTGLGALTVGASGYALAAHRLWLPVATPLAGLLLFQLLWNWRRGVALGQVFKRRIERLEAVLAQAPGERDPRAAVPPAAPSRRRLGQARPQVEVLDDTLGRLEAQHQIQRRMQQQRDRWLAFLSHDLRAPQSNILSLLELHENGVEGMSNERLFSGVRVQVDRTLRLAEGFVDLLRAESDHLKLQPCSLGSLTVEAVDRCWPQAQAQQVTIVHRGADDGQGLVLGDPELLTRALVNMLGNAVRHSKEGDTVEVCVAHDADARQVAWSVRDRGPGMEPDQLSALVAALDSHTWMRPRPPAGVGQRGGQGLGLGLLVARTVVSRHQGELHAMAAPGQGSCFIVVLPAAAPPTRHTRLGQRWPPLRTENPPVGTRALQA